MSLFKFPFFRKSLPSVGNPVFIDDILAANQLTIDGLTALTNLPNPGFAIISGLAFIAGSPNTFTPGVIWLNGFFYAINAGFSEGLYIVPQNQDTNNEPFSDAVNRPTYTLYIGTSTNVPTGASPVFSGNMNAYRIGNNDLKAALTALQAQFATLGAAAFAGIGNTGGTVAAGNDPRFGYTVAQINTLFQTIANSLSLNQTAVFLPTPGSYEPATALYADQAAGCKLLWVGNFSGSGASVTKLGPSASTIVVTYVRTGTGAYTISHNIGSTNYFVVGMGIDPIGIVVSPRSAYSQTSSGFKTATSDDSSANDADFQLAIFQYY